MTGGEVAVLVVGGLGVVGLLLLSVALVAVARSLRGLQATVELVRQDAAARTWPAAPSAGALGDGSTPSTARRRDAGSLLARAAVANPYLDVSSPVIKVLALASGTTRAASRLRRSRPEAR